jgi:glucose/arabinose dehydrogenase
LRVEATGIRLPRGLAFDTYGQLYFTNNGMELRGTRPVKDDPDSLMKFVQGTDYGFPDYSTDLYPISDPRFQPPIELIIRTGYPELSFLIDHRASNPPLQSPAPYRDSLLRATFPSQSGAAKLAFVPDAGAFKGFEGEAIVALSGDRSPFATSGRQLVGPQGFRIMTLTVDADPARRNLRDFIRNTSGKPASADGRGGGLERPVDVKFGPDGALYVLDFGRMTVEGGREKVQRGTGRVLKLIPAESIATRATTAPSR